MTTITTLTALIICLSGKLVYTTIRYKRLLAKHKIVVNELCDYLDAEEQEESEWGNKR